MFLVLFALLGHVAEAQTDVVAVIGGRPLTDAELEEIGKDQLARVKSEELSIKRQVLEDYIVKRLLEDEAKARGVTVQALERSEIDAKALPVTDDQKRAVYETVPQNYAGKTEAEAFQMIEQNLRKIRVAEARRRFLADLRKKAGVQVLLKGPVVTAGAATTGGDPVTGPSNARVTVVEYSDFQCPFCARSYETLKQLRVKYKDSVKFVFKDFPLSIHPQAPKAAEAGSCALEQGRFWEFHARVFENQRALQVPDLKKTAAALGLDAQRFDQCLDSGKFDAEWKEDMAEGTKLGVSATPTMLINSRLVVGAKSLDEMSAIIEEELQKARAGAAQD